MFVCELVVLASIIFLSTLFGRSVILLETPLEEYCTGVVSSVCKSISTIQEHCTKVVSYVHDVLCPGFQTTLAHFFSRFLKSKSLATGEIDHNINFLCYFICSKT